MIHENRHPKNAMTLVAALTALGGGETAPSPPQLLAHFVLAVFDASAGVVGRGEIEEELQKMYGWILPPTLLSETLKILISNNKIKEVSKDRFSSVSLPTEGALRAHESFKNEFVAPIKKFIEEEVPLLNVEISDDDIAEAVLAHLGSAMGGSSEEEMQFGASAPAGYWVARYLTSRKHARSKDRSVPIWLQRSVIAFQIIKNLSDIGKAVPKRPDVKVLLDTPFLLDSIGFGGEQAHVEAHTAVVTLAKAGVTISAFEHNLREAKEIVAAALNYGGENAKSVNQYLARTGMAGRSLAAEFIQDPLSFAKKIIGIDNMDAIDLRRISSASEFSETDWAHFYNALAWHQNEKARAIAADSVKGVYLLREESFSSSVWDAKALLLTTNSRFMDCAKRTAVTLNIQGQNSIGPVLHTGAIQALLWLSGYREQAERIGTAQLLESAERVAGVSDAWLRKTSQVLADYDALPEAHRAGLASDPLFNRLTMDSVSGNLDHLDVKKIEAVVESFQHRLKLDLEREGRIESRKTREISQKIVEAKNERIRKLEELAAAESKNVSNLNHQLREERMSGINRAVDMVRGVILACEWLIYICLIGGSIALSYYIWGIEDSLKQKTPWLAFLLVFAGGLVVNLLLELGRNDRRRLLSGISGRAVVKSGLSSLLLRLVCGAEVSKNHVIQVRAGNVFVSDR